MKFIIFRHLSAYIYFFGYTFRCCRLKGFDVPDEWGQNFTKRPPSAHRNFDLTKKSPAALAVLLIIHSTPIFNIYLN